MNPLTRRTFLGRMSAAAATAAWTLPSFGLPEAETKPVRRMTLDLTGGAIGVTANQNELLVLAVRHGFESIEPKPADLASYKAEALAALQARMQMANIRWGSAGLPVEFRREEARFREDMNSLPKLAAALQRAGAERVGTWLMPGDNNLTYMQNLRRHTARLREVATVLDDHGLRFGLEFVGTIQSRFRLKYPFVHTLAETRELNSEIDRKNMGVILDAWHWWMAGDTAEDIMSLKNAEVVAVDLNDAPAGVEKRDQQDGRRELPAATGVIDIASFLGALARIGYDGPARAEPFNRPLNDLDNDAACAATIQALRKAVAWVF